MTCRSCASGNLRSFPIEAAIHFPGLKNIDRPPIFIFPEISVCLDCGHAEVEIPEDELRVLAGGDYGWLGRWEYQSASNS
jgi:hypothetical protein